MPYEVATPMVHRYYRLPSLTSLASFEAAAPKCEGVFETLNMITRMLLHKLLSQTTSQKPAAAAVA